MLPVVNLNDQVTNEPTLSKGIVYEFDFEKKSYKLVDGKLVELTSVEDRVKQWLQFFINTEYGLYDTYKGLNFGLSLKKYIGKKSISLALIASEVSDQLALGIVLNDDIKEISSVKAFKEKDLLKLSISVKTKNNTIVEVVS